MNAIASTVRSVPAFPAVHFQAVTGKVQCECAINKTQKRARRTRERRVHTISGTKDPGPRMGMHVHRVPTHGAGDTRRPGSEVRSVTVTRVTCEERRASFKEPNIPRLRSVPA